MVLDLVLPGRAVGHALPARVAPGERRLDAVRCVVREGQRDRAGGRDRQQVAVADADVSRIVRAMCVRQALREAALQVAFGVERWERALLARPVRSEAM